jgi:hypothetical protein
VETIALILAGVLAVELLIAAQVVGWYRGQVEGEGEG